MIVEIINILGQFFFNAYFLGVNALEALYLSIISAPGLAVGCVFLSIAIIWGVHRIDTEVITPRRLIFIGLLFSSNAFVLYIVHLMWLWPLGLLASMWVVAGCPMRKPIKWMIKKYKAIGFSMIVIGMVLSSFGNSIRSMIDLSIPMHWAWLLGVIGGSAAFLMYGVQMYRLATAGAQKETVKEQDAKMAIHKVKFWERWMQRVFSFIGQVNFCVINPALVSVGGLLLFSSLSTSGALFSLWSLALGGAWFWACGMMPAYMVTYDFLKQIGKRIGRWLDRPQRFTGATLTACVIALPTVLGSMGNAYWCGENILRQIEYLLSAQGVMAQWLHAYPILNPILGFIFMGLTFFSAGALYFTFTEKQLQQFKPCSPDDVPSNAAKRSEESSLGNKSFDFKRNLSIGLYVLIASAVMTAIYANRMDIMFLEWNVPHHAVTLITMIAVIFVFSNFALSFWNRTLEAEKILGTIFNDRPIDANDLKYGQGDKQCHKKQKSSQSNDKDSKACNVEKNYVLG